MRCIHSSRHVRARGVGITSVKMCGGGIFLKRGVVARVFVLMVGLAQLAGGSNPSLSTRQRCKDHEMTGDDVIKPCVQNVGQYGPAACRGEMRVANNNNDLCVIIRSLGCNSKTMTSCLARSIFFSTWLWVIVPPPPPNSHDALGSWSRVVGITFTTRCTLST